MKKLLLHLIPPETIRKLYWEEDKSRTEIGALFGCSECAVRNYMKRHEIPARDLRDANRLVALSDETQRKRRAKLQGKPTWSKGKTWKQSADAVEKKRARSFGAMNNAWKGGISSDPEHLRQQRRNHKAIRRGKSQHMPAWADKAAIAAIYKAAKDAGKTVDHIVPLSHRLVCGLHCEANLRIVSADENRKKGNTFAVG